MKLGGHEAKQSEGRSGRELLLFGTRFKNGFLYQIGLILIDI